MKPHEILGLRENATVDEATDRYNRLVRQLKEADLSNSPLQKDREFRLLQLRAAYDSIVYNIPFPDHLNQVPGIETGEDDKAPSLYSKAEKDIDDKQYDSAIRSLDTMQEHTAYWNYLYGFSLACKGMIYDAAHYLQQAVALDPSDADFKAALVALEQDIEAAREEEKRIKKQEAAKTAATATLCFAGSCASCACDSCFNS